MLVMRLVIPCPRPRDLREDQDEENWMLEKMVERSMLQKILGWMLLIHLLLFLVVLMVLRDQSGQPRRPNILLSPSVNLKFGSERKAIPSDSACCKTMPRYNLPTRSGPGRDEFKLYQ